MPFESGEKPMSKIYRKASINNYSDPEQTDRAVRITSPYSGLWIIAAALLIGSVIVWAVFGSIPDVMSVKAVLSDKTNSFAVHSSVSGSLTEYKVDEGDEVKVGQTVAIVRYSGKNVGIKSPINGTVGELLFREGEFIYAYDEILRITPAVSDENVFVSYVTVTESSKVKVGMEARFFIDESSSLDGEVIAVGEYAASQKNMRYIIGRDNSLRNSLTKGQAVTAVVYRIKNKSVNGEYVLADNRKTTVKKSAVVKAKIITRNRTPVSLLFGFLTSGEA